MRKSPVITILFNTKERTFLGRGGKWQPPDEFLRNPPEVNEDVVPDPTRPPDLAGDPGPSYECLNGSLFYVDIDPNTGQKRMRRIGAC